jgi:quinol monooxygenase YgiN
VIISILKIFPTPEHREETLEILRSVQGPAQAHPGCIACRVYVEDGADEAILFWQQWASSAAFHELVRSELYRRVLAALDLSSQPPEVCVHHVSSTEGMDAIRRIRSREESDFERIDH